MEHLYHVPYSTTLWLSSRRGLDFISSSFELLDPSLTGQLGRPAIGIRAAALSRTRGVREPQRS